MCVYIYASMNIYTHTQTRTYAYIHICIFGTQCQSTNVVVTAMNATDATNATNATNTANLTNVLNVTYMTFSEGGSAEGSGGGARDCEVIEISGTRVCVPPSVYPITVCFLY